MTDPYPVVNFTCLTGYDHTPSRNYTIVGNVFWNNGAPGRNDSFAVSLQNTTESLVANNAFNQSNDVSDFAASHPLWARHGDAFALPTKVHRRNVIGGPNIGGNYYQRYSGCERVAGTGIGDVPYDAAGGIAPADALPLTNKPCTASDGTQGVGD